MATHAVQPDGPPDPTRPVPLASTREIVVLAAWARAVEAMLAVAIFPDQAAPAVPPAKPLDSAR